jgi:hypothetical protein
MIINRLRPNRESSEQIERRIYEDEKRFYQEYKEFWKPLMQEQPTETKGKNQ